MLSSRRAKIVCTIGPALATKDDLKKAIECGMNVARLNFSHGTHDDHARNIQDIRSLSRERVRVREIVSVRVKVRVRVRGRST